ncbi:unnamed protein product [Blepharisma stoltei]|uniref:Uncharacterized protein n=1 Tax=Blepharisma stoltei TaxID=1481888 RepID=A0AAU9J0R4_9CILI|nr:unnamed protein product [Blepharisma stoltei]
MDLKFKESCATDRDFHMNSVRTKVSVSPSSTLPSARCETNKKISKKLKGLHKKISLLQDIQAYTAYIDDLSRWIEDYFFTSFSLELSTIPQVPRTETIFDMESSMKILVNSLVKVRKEASDRLANQEEKFMKSRAQIEENLKQLKTEMQKLTWNVQDESKKQIIVEVPIKDNFSLNLCIEECAKLKKELEASQEINENCKGSMQFLLQEFQKEGFARQKQGDLLVDVLSDLKNFTLNILKERRDYISQNASMKMTAEKERYERTKFLTEYVDRVREINEENDKLKKEIENKAEEYDYINGKIKEFEAKMDEARNQIKNITEQNTLTNKKLENARVYITMACRIIVSVIAKFKNLQSLISSYKENIKDIQKVANQFSTPKKVELPYSKRPKISKLRPKIIAVIAMIRLTNILKLKRVRISNFSIQILASKPNISALSLEKNPTFTIFSDIFESTAITPYPNYFSSQLFDFKKLKTKLSEASKNIKQYQEENSNYEKKSAVNDMKYSNLKKKYKDLLNKFNLFKQELDNIKSKIPSENVSDEKQQKLKNKYEKLKMQLEVLRTKYAEKEEERRKMKLKLKELATIKKKLIQKVKDLESRQEDLMKIIKKTKVKNRIVNLNEEISNLKKEYEIMNKEDAGKIAKKTETSLGVSKSSSCSFDPNESFYLESSSIELE